MSSHMVTYRYRVKDKHCAQLNRLARKVNFVWNFCNDTQKHALKWDKKWPTNYDLQKLITGASKELGLGADTMAKICQRYAKSRRQSRKPYLRYRGQKNMGWIPMRGENLRLIDGKFVYAGKGYSVWMSREIPPGAKFCDGTNFSCNAKGQWFLNVVIEIPTTETSLGNPAVGIDLGLKDFAALSTGEKIAAPQFYRKTQKKLAMAQRARKKRQIASISMKISNQRRDFHHKLSTNIIKNHGLIVVGDVRSSKLKRTKMAKSVSDAGWHSFKLKLAYKSIANGARYIEVNEAFTTQTCSDCGSVSGPKGRQGLSVRRWVCPCGADHDRDVNSAINIVRLGHETLTGAVQ